MPFPGHCCNYTVLTRKALLLLLLIIPPPSTHHLPRGWFLFVPSSTNVYCDMLDHSRDVYQSLLRSKRMGVVSGYVVQQSSAIYVGTETDDDLMGRGSVKGKCWLASLNWGFRIVLWSALGPLLVMGMGLERSSWQWLKAMRRGGGWQRRREMAEGDIVCPLRIESIVKYN